LAHYAARWRRPISSGDDGPPEPEADRSLDRTVDQVAYRLIRESLTNAAKYADQGSAAEITVSWNDDVLLLAVVNVASADERASNSAIALPSSGLGLLGLRERVEMAGGRFATSYVDQRFTVRAELPLTVVPPEGRSETAGSSR
jgi:signal transduction histidine kinase